MEMLVTIVNLSRMESGILLYHFEISSKFMQLMDQFSNHANSFKSCPKNGGGMDGGAFCSRGKNGLNNFAQTFIINYDRICKRQAMETLAKENTAKKPVQRFMTEEEFLESCDEDVRTEFIDGRIIVHSPASIRHGDESLFVVWLVRLFVDKHDLGRVWSDNVQVRLRQGLRRVPDMLFVSKENTRVKITATEIHGAPDLVVEIVSPDSVDRDWRDKFHEYEKAKVKEYWIIDPGNQRLEIYGLSDKGKYEAQAKARGIVKSKVLPGFWLKSEWLWQDPLPNVIAVAKELKIKI